MTLGLAALAGIAALGRPQYLAALRPPTFLASSGWSLLLFETPWATAPLTLVLGDLMFEMPPAAGTMLKTLLVSLPALILTQFVVRGLLILFVFTYPLMPSQYAFLERGDLARTGRAFSDSFGRSRALSRGFEGELFLRWIGQIFLGSIFALCFWMSVRDLDHDPGRRRADLVPAGAQRSGRPAVSGGRLDRDRLFRGLSLPLLHRPADPARGLGTGAAAQGGRPRLGGETDLTSLPVIAPGAAWPWGRTGGRAADAAAAALTRTSPRPRVSVDHPAHRDEPGQGRAPGRKLSLVRSRRRSRPAGLAGPRGHGSGGCFDRLEKVFKAIDRFLQSAQPRRWTVGQG